MYPLVLAKCWRLDDGTACLLSKVSERTWELCVTHGSRLARVEVFSNLAVAVKQADKWRAQLAPHAKTA